MLAHYIAYFFGGMFFFNAVPHIVSGLMGKPLQTPFANPPGEGLSSSVVNAAWGFFNLIIAYTLLVHVGDFNLHAIDHAIAAGAGGLLISLYLAVHFGRFNGGRTPGAS